MSRIDRIALLVSFLTVVAGIVVADQVYENLVHLEDEFAYLWQAQVIARGKLTLPSPQFPKSFLVPFVVDYQGMRFGKYPLGWPVVLSFGVRFGIERWVNPLLGGVAIWLTYRLAKRAFGEVVGLITSVLMSLSPFFLIQIGSLLSHPWSLVLSLMFVLSWLDSVLDNKDRWVEHTWIPPVVAGLSLGLLGLTRPMTMLALAVPFGLHGLISMGTAEPTQRRRILLVGGLTVFLGSFHFVWQWAVTGSFFLNPYTLWWPYDRIGFGEGVGVLKGGHTLRQAWTNTKHSLRTGLSDLFGWATFSWIFLPFGLWAARKRSETYLMVSFFVSLVSIYMAYWIGSWLLGPRYYFEALPVFAILSAVGIAWLAGWPILPDQPPQVQLERNKRRPLAIFSVILLCLFANLWFYLPIRMKSLQDLYTITRADTDLFTGHAPEVQIPALVIVHSDQWMSYGNLSQLSSPFLDSPYIFAWSIGPRTNQEITELYQQERTIYHYYPDTAPGNIYSSPLNYESEPMP